MITYKFDVNYYFIFILYLPKKFTKDKTEK